MQQSFADAGLNLVVIESTPPMHKVRLGLPGRDEELAQISQMLTNMGAVGIPVWCYNFMGGFGWLRTSTTIQSRGGALVSGYDHTLLAHAPLTEYGEINEERLWENYAYFLACILPVALQAGVKLALHPDDPPISPIRGIARIFRSSEAFIRALSFADSPVHGLTFCQGSFATMGVDIPNTIRRFAEKIFFVHFRDVIGTPARFVETFHDHGPTDMLAAMRAYREIGYTGVIRPDHVPTLAGDANDTPGYTIRGRLFATGYMRGLLEAVGS
jgi:mannonate dehydratase